jgi:hypothetical protein
MEVSVMVAQAGVPAAARLPDGAAPGPRHLARSWLRRRDESRDIPAVARPALVSGERWLTAEVDARGVPVVATNRAVYHRDSGGGWLRLGWEQVGRVDWDEPRRTLLLTGLTPDVPRRVLLTVRRQPGSDRLLWVVAFDDGVDRDDPATSLRLASALARLRAETGI